MEENKDYQDIFDQAPTPPSIWSVVPPNLQNTAPYLNWLAKHGSSLTDMHAEAHPSQPNYLALFSGSTAGVSGDTPPSTLLTRPTLAGELIGAGFTFKSYSEGLPSVGSRTQKSGEYALKHNPAADFTDVPAADNVPFSQFPTKYAKLPTVSMVIPNQLHDMHSASMRDGDDWLKSNLGGYASRAKTHNSLLIVTWDEGRSTSSNHIPTIFYGANVKAHAYGEDVNHYNVLRTLEDMYDLTPLGASADAGSIRGIFSDVLV
jgi:acid phosphatase